VGKPKKAEVVKRERTKHLSHNERTVAAPRLGIVRMAMPMNIAPKSPPVQDIHRRERPAAGGQEKPAGWPTSRAWRTELRSQICIQDLLQGDADALWIANVRGSNIERT
jgi:hypothetical protein